MSYKCAIRIINVDFYMSSPCPEFDVLYSEFRGSSISQVPVIRIFGSTDIGKKICLHVHGVFPYLYIPYDGTEDVNILKYQIAANIDKAINISFGQASSTAQHVYKIVLVSGIPFYGYHVKEHQFFKIYLLNPILIKKVSNLLQSEVILGRLYQPHESHIPYILQFMIDYNLHGMSKILLSNLNFRNNSSDSVPKQSNCELEADTLSEHILNRLEISKDNLGINPGIAALWEDEKQRLRDKGEDSEIGSCLTLDNSQVEPTKTHKIFKQALSERLCLSEDLSEKPEENMSVYPAETPRNKSLLSASSVNISSQYSSESLNESVDLNATFDENAQDLYDILQDLGRRNLENEENDSILSQVQIVEEEEENNQEFFDLSMSLADTTPFKDIMQNLSEDELDTTLIPQLDGSVDESEGSRSKSTQKKKSKYGALPILVNSSNPGNNSDTTEEIDLLQHAKRKLSFSNKSTNVTVCEEKVVCEYKSKIKTRIKNIHENDLVSKDRIILEKSDFPQNTAICNISKENNINDIAKESPEEEDCIVEQSIEEKNENPQKVKDDKTVAHQSTKPFTAAEIYDLQTNYKAKEGCSTKFSQDTKESNNSKLPSQSSSDIFSHKSNEFFSQTSRDSVDTAKNDEDFSGEFQFTREENESRFQLIAPMLTPPSKEGVLSSLESLNIPNVVHEKPFYSDPNDVTGSVEIGHSVLKINSKTTIHLEDFKTRYDGIDAYRKKKISSNMKWTYENVKKLKLTYCGDNYCTIAPVKRPPTIEEVEKWLVNKSQVKKSIVKETKIEKIVIPNSPDQNNSDLELTLSLSPDDVTTPVVDKELKKRQSDFNSCQITGTSLDNTYGFKITPENFQNAKAVNEYQYITIFALEVHVETRGDLKPDPEYDAVKAVFYSIIEDGPDQKHKIGCLGIDIRIGEVQNEIISVNTEEEIFQELIKMIHEWDPDLIIGYEIELLSWGYLLSRSKFLKIDLLSEISRIKEKTKGYADEGLKVTGRIMLDVWRLLRHEISLQSYTFENIAYHLLHRRIPMYSFKDLTNWWKSSLFRHRTISYYLLRTEGILQIMDQLDLIGRTSELARLFGIQFFEVLSRGSQFRVESMMLRLAKPLNYIPVSPSVQQRAKMKAPEFLPLILEPESKLYVDPVIVLDFQSLYPSVIIAYNYCFSTCLGRVIHLGKNAPFEFGATQLKVSKRRVKKLLDSDGLNFSPCGVAFVKKQVREGILPRMLKEILETRLMVKNSMKKNKGDKLLQKVLHNRQLGLKLIANVTYGYTAANFSGRMPSVELGDSVVSKGRETLQRAIEMVENTSEWKARVVYGDTDSLFVMVPGRSKAEAFEIGKEIAEAVTNANPDPVKLKLEKVYQPCILQTKKRYVGYMYESPEQQEPIYDAKGIETVRRDGCPAVSKMLEKCLRILFETMNVSLVKQYVIRQFHKILIGRVSLQDLTFAKEYRGASGYKPGACVPALELTKKWTAVDRRNEPRRGERVPYVIVNGPPGVPLIRLVRSPREFFQDPSLRPNAIYYITKVIMPPINRCFNLIGADLIGWFNQMPRKHLQYLRNPSPIKKSTISQYFVSNSCAACTQQTHGFLCDKCNKNPQNTVVILHEKIRVWEKAYCDISLICQTCAGFMETGLCTSLDCPVLYKLHQTSRDLEQATFVREVINSLSCEMNF